MKTIHTLIAGLTLAAAAVPALAADEGLPPQLAAQQQQAVATAAANAPAASTPAIAPLLTGKGELTVVRNPAFVSPRLERTDSAEIRRNSVPATTYVGA